jgi:hypothetical protein
VHSMPCMVMCGTRPGCICACENTGGTLGVHRHAVRVQSKGRGGSYSRSGRWAMVGWCGRWRVGLVGERTSPGFPSMPQPNGHALAASVREKEGKVR